MKQYHDLLRAVLERGYFKQPAREGMPGTTSLFGFQARYNLSEGFPILTTKKMFWKGIVVELLWFLRGDTNIKYLDENGVSKLWHQDAYNFYRLNFSKRLHKGAGNDTPLTFDEFCQEIRKTPREQLPYFKTQDGSYTLGDCGHQYGKVWRAWDKGEEVIDQIANVIESLKTSPFGRRHIVTAVDPAHDQDLALYWCHAMFQFNCRKLSREERKAWAEKNNIDLSNGMFPLAVPEYYLDCQLTQRSCDVLLGAGFNISSYALLTHMIAKVLNMVPGEFIHSLADAHIYDNHLEAVHEQLSRDYTKYKLPELELSGDWSATKDGDFSALKPEDFKLIGYESYGVLTSDTTLSTGMKK